MQQAERWYGTGRRKESTARVWIMAGDGQIQINERSFDDYFPRESWRVMMQQPLDLVEQRGMLNIRGNV